MNLIFNHSKFVYLFCFTIVILLFNLNCRPKQNNDDINSKSESTPKKDKNTDTLNNIYLYKDSNIIQQLILYEYSDKKIKFAYTIKDLFNKKDVSISGFAINEHPDEDLESDDDEEEKISYFCLQFNYEGPSYNLFIRIDEEMGRIQIKALETKANYSANILKSKGVLRKIRNP